MPTNKPSKNRKVDPSIAYAAYRLFRKKQPSFMDETAREVAWASAGSSTQKAYIDQVKLVVSAMRQAETTRKRQAQRIARETHDPKKTLSLEGMQSLTDVLQEIPGYKLPKAGETQPDY